MKEQAKEKTAKPAAVKVQDLKPKANPTGGSMRRENFEKFGEHSGRQKLK